MADDDLDYHNARAAIPVLLVAPNATTAGQLRLALKTLGFGVISSTQTHVAGVDKIRERSFPLVIFDAKQTDMPTKEFVRQSLAYGSSATLIPYSAEPNVDDVFGLLQAGAKHFISLPFNAETIEEVILRAAEGPPLSEAVLNAIDRNSALAGLVLNCLYRVTVLQRQVRECPRWKHVLEREQAFLEEATHLAKMFCEGGPDALQEKIMEGCIARSEVASTRIGRARARLQKQRAKKNQEGRSTQDRLMGAAVDALRRP